MDNLNGKTVENLILNLEISQCLNLMIPLSATSSSSTSEIKNLSELSENRNAFKRNLNVRVINPDIEVQIPVNELALVSQYSFVDSTPTGSYSSPFFPEAYTYSYLSSPRSQINLPEINNDDSVISVNKIPSEIKFCEISQHIIKDDSPKSANMIRHEINFCEPSQYSENESKQIKKKLNEKKIQMVNCDICERIIKKKSMKAHIQTKVHQNNLKLNT